MQKESPVLIGNGMAGLCALEELLKQAPKRYESTVFGAESLPNYNCIMRSPVLAWEKIVDDIVLNDIEWYADNGITLKTGVITAKTDCVARSVLESTCRLA